MKTILLITVCSFVLGCNPPSSKLVSSETPDASNKVTPVEKSIGPATAADSARADEEVLE